MSKDFQEWLQAVDSEKPTHSDQQSATSSTRSAADDAQSSANDAASPAVSATSSRRKFLTTAGIAGLGALAATALPTTSAQAQLSSSNFRFDDFNILNFALNLEYLEAEYYLRGAFGRGLDDSDTTGTGNRGAVIGGRQVPFATEAIRQYAEEIARDEEAHVKLLRNALGSRRVARPTIDIEQSFTTAARAAGLVGPNQSFDPYADEDSFLLGAFVFEDVGVTAYKGAAPFILRRAFLSAAAGLLAVEAYHAGEIRTLLLQRGLAGAAQAISDLRDSADGPTDLDQGILDGNGRINIVPTDANGLVFDRTTQQVLNIVYLGGAAANFGFFPNRLNGSIR